METEINIVSADALGALEADITNILIRSTNPACPGSSSATAKVYALSQKVIISGISTEPADIPTVTVCPQLEETGACYDVAGQLALFVAGGRRFLSDGLNINDAARLSIKSAMDSGELAEGVDGITRLSWVNEEEVTILDRPIDTDEPLDDGEIDNILVYYMLSASGGLLIATYGLHRLQKRRDLLSRHTAQLSDSDENYSTEIA